MPDAHPSAAATPPGYPTLCPYLIIDGAEAAMHFYMKVFHADLRMRLDAPGGKVAHAELGFGGSIIMLADPYPDMDAHPPGKYGGSPVSLHIYVPDVDATVKLAAQQGAAVVRPPKDQFYGDRSATLRDPFGHTWSVATHVEDVAPEELDRRFKAMAPV
jgi:PhnB protein